MEDIIAALQGTDDNTPDSDVLHKAMSMICDKLNDAQDSHGYSFSVSSPGDFTGDSNLSAHNFMFTITKQF